MYQAIIDYQRKSREGVIGGLWGAMASLRNKIDKVHEVTKRAEYSLAGGHAETAYVLLALDGKELSEVSEEQGVEHAKVQVKEFICTPSNTLSYIFAFRLLSPPTSLRC